jgi:hypothetical protein
MSPMGSETKNDCTGEAQQQIVQILRFWTLSKIPSGLFFNDDFN